MPFTLSHLAVVLPTAFRRGGPFGVALCIGAMVPDLPYFIPGRPGVRISHLAVGLVTFDRVVGIACVLAFYRWFIRPLHNLAPLWWRRRVPEPHRPLIRRDAWPVTGGIFIGAATHIVWDSFTHHLGPIVRVTALKAPLFTSGDYILHTYGLLQHLSTVLGAIAVIWLTRRFIVRTPPSLSPEPTRWPLARRLIALSTFGTGALMATLVALGWLPGVAPSIPIAVWLGATGSGMGLLASFAIYATRFNRASQRPIAMP